MAKRKKTFNKNIIYAILIFILVVFIVVICDKFLIIEYESSFDSIFTNVTKDLISAFLITFCFGIVFKMFTENLISTKKNDVQLKKCGIDYIGNGKSTLKEIKMIMGNPLINDYPNEIHLLFITGINFLKTFKKELERAIKNGAVVKILLVSIDEDNLEFLDRLATTLNSSKDIFIKEIHEVEKLVNEMNKKIIDPNKKIKIRYFKDEYFYNFRSAIYSYKNTEIHKVIINLNPFNKVAIDCSISLSGTYNDLDDINNNILALDELTFNILWEKYK